MNLYEELENLSAQYKWIPTMWLADFCGWLLKVADDLEKRK